MFPILPSMRSKLFVPGSRPELFPKALASSADALSFDLEDAVSETEKAQAQRLVEGALLSPQAAASSKTLIVRVNPLNSTHFEADLEAVIGPRLNLINLPKVESAEEIHVALNIITRLERARGLKRPIGLLANIESPRGLRFAADIAASDSRVVGLQLGLADLFEPFGIDRNDASAVHQVQLAVRLAAGEAGIDAYDSAYGATHDSAGLQREAMAARRLGYRGKTCVHPHQITVVNEIFQPSAGEIAFALRVVEAAAGTSRGVFLVDGKMIDAPFLARARTIIAFTQPGRS